MTPQMGIVTDADLAAAIAAHNALTIVHGTVDDVADQTDIATHTADVDAHHPEEIPDGRGKSATETFLTIPGISAQGQTTQARGSNTIYYYPIYVRTPITIDQIVIEVTGAAGAGEKCRITIYEADKDWQPGVAVIATGEIACDAIAVVTTGIADTILKEGRYLMACIFEGITTLRTLQYPTILHGYAATLGATPFIRYLSVAQAYGALPDPGTAWDTATQADEGPQYFMFVRVKTP